MSRSSRSGPSSTGSQGSCWSPAAGKAPRGECAKKFTADISLFDRVYFFSEIQTQVFDRARRVYIFSKSFLSVTVTVSTSTCSLAVAGQQIKKCAVAGHTSSLFSFYFLFISPSPLPSITFWRVKGAPLLASLPVLRGLLAFSFAFFPFFKFFTFSFHS